MKIEVVETETDFCEDLEDLQYLSDLKVLFLTDYTSEGINDLKSCSENFNKLNLPHGLKYIFIDFNDFYKLNDKDKTEAHDIIEMLKIPFGCKLNAIFRNNDLGKFYYLYSRDNITQNGSYELQRDIFLSLKQNYDSNNHFITQNLPQLVLIQQLIQNQKE